MSSLLSVALLGGFDDLLVTLPAIHALARLSPGCRLTVLTMERTVGLLRFDRLVAETIGEPISEREGNHSTWGTVELLLATCRFDLWSPTH